jgi:hypothetical protein
MSNTIEALREELFGTLRALRSAENPMDIERAKAVVNVADAIIDSAKVEVDYMKVTGADGTGFIPTHKSPTPLPPPDGITPPGLVSTVRHHLK